MTTHKTKLVYLFRFILALLFVQWAFITLPEFRQHYIYFLFKHGFTYLPAIYKGLGMNVLESSELSGEGFKYNALSMAAAEGNLKVFEKLKEFGFNDKEDLGKSTTPRSIMLAAFFSRTIDKKNINDPELKALVNKAYDNSMLESLHYRIFNLDFKDPIPHSKFAHNPSIIKYKDGFLMAARIDTETDTEKTNTEMDGKEFSDLKAAISHIELTKLNKDLKQIAPAAIISNSFRGCPDKCSAQDPRLFVVNGKIYLIFNMAENILGKGLIHSYNRSLYIAEIGESTNNNFEVKDFKKLYWAGQSKYDKNWTPIVIEKELYLVYSIAPKLVTLKVNLKTGECLEHSSTTNGYKSLYGSLSGGPAFVQLEDGSYLSFFHSYSSILSFDDDKWFFKRFYFAIPVIIKKDANNRLFFYKVAEVPILSQTPPSINLGTPFNFMHVHFPAGLVDLGDSLLVASGFHDQEIAFYKVNKKKLLHQMLLVN